MSNKQILRKFLSFSIGNWLNILIGVIVIPLVTRLLSPEEFGRVSMFVLAVNILMIIINFGNDQSLVRFYYEEDKRNRPRLLLQCLKLPFVVFLVLTLVVLLFKKNISYLLFNIYDVEAIYLLIIAMFFSFINNFGLLVIRMEQKGLKYSLLQFSTKFLDLLFILLFYYLIGAEYKIMLYSYTISLFLVAIFTVYFGKGLWFNMFNKTDLNLKNSFAETIKYAYPLLFTTAFVWVFQSIDKFSIKHWNTMEELGLYAAAYKIVALLFILRTSFTTYWAPLSLEKYHKNPENKSFFEKMFLLVFAAMLFVIIGFIMSKDLIIYFLGESYRTSANLLPFLVLIPFMSAVSEVTQIGISFAKKPKWNMLITFIVCMVNIAGNFILVPTLGAKGAAISTGLSYILYFVLRTHISLKYFKVNYHLKKTYFFVLLLIMYCFYSTFWAWNIWNLVFGIVLLLVFSLSNYGFIKSNLRKLLLSYAK